MQVDTKGSVCTGKIEKKEYVCAASIKRIETNELELIKTTAEGKRTATQKKIKKDILEIGGNIPV